MIKENWVEVEYLHKLTEDICENVKAGTVLGGSSDPEKIAEGI